jgi:hypothetical protein
MAAGPHNPTLTREIMQPLFKIICESFILVSGLIPEKNDHQQFQENHNLKCNGWNKR